VSMVDKVKAYLDRIPGREMEKAFVLETAMRLESTSAPAELWKAYAAWLKSGGWLKKESASERLVYERLPNSIFEMPASIVGGKPLSHAQRMENRQRRIENIRRALAAGWDDEEAIAFAAGRDEWAEAKGLDADEMIWNSASNAPTLEERSDDEEDPSIPW
jgi:hypothetical protein